MSKIVVSYRRSDSQAISGRIVDRLIAHFGDASVFMDIENIPFGIDFRRHIKSALSQADMLLAIVGPGWLAPGTGGRSRLQDDSDPVRVEIETALAEKLHIIPILVGGAAMPKASELPDSLKDFSFLNAAPVDAGRDFNSHIGRLIQSIGEVLSQEPARAARSPIAHSKSVVWLGAIAVVLLLIAAAAAWLITSTLMQKSAPAPAAVALASKQTSPDPPVPAPASTPSGDDLQWDIVKSTSDTGVLKRFIELNPASKHRLDAEERIASLDAPPPPVVAPPSGSPTPAASANEQPVKTPPAAASMAAPVSASPQNPAISTPPPATASAGRFDGLWVATVACDKKGDVQAWNRQCIGWVKASVYHCEWGNPGQPGYTQFDGAIATDGSIDLIQKGLTVDAAYSLVRRSGAKFAFPWSGRFDDAHGKVTRVEGRTCRMDLVKQ